MDISLNSESSFSINPASTSRYWGDRVHEIYRGSTMSELFMK